MDFLAHRAQVLLPRRQALFVVVDELGQLPGGRGDVPGQEGLTQVRPHCVGWTQGVQKMSVEMQIAH
mgnify:CR=1 FL=1